MNSYLSEQNEKNNLKLFIKPKVNVAGADIGRKQKRLSFFVLYFGL